MSHLTTILLIIVGVLLIGDLFFLNNIIKLLKKKKKTNVDEKYFELKYHLNLLKSTSAILIFIFGFLGYSSFTDFKNNMKSDLDKTLEYQKNEISELNKTLDNYKKSLDSLTLFKNQLKSLMLVNDSDLKKINNKVLNINSSFKYNPKIYIVNELNYPYNGEELRFNFSDMKTIHGESLPKFNKVPFITVQGYRAGIDILEITTTSILLNMSMTYGGKDGKFIKNHKFDLWIGSQE